MASRVAYEEAGVSAQQALMNVYPFSPDPGGPPAPPEWTMEVGSDGAGDDLYFFADVRRSGARVCRVAAAGKLRSEDEARRHLAVRTRLWIAEYLTRSHTGCTHFGDLQ